MHVALEGSLAAKFTTDCGEIFIFTRVLVLYEVVGYEFVEMWVVG